tara:strand:+ start:148 stop:360 length:213 start_codon:yes stop_codon:yes gene_type:complete
MFSTQEAGTRSPYVQYGGPIMGARVCSAQHRGGVGVLHDHLEVRAVDAVALTERLDVLREADRLPVYTGR